MAFCLGFWGALDFVLVKHPKKCLVNGFYVLSQTQKATMSSIFIGFWFNDPLFLINQQLSFTLSVHLKRPTYQVVNDQPTTIKQTKKE